MPRFSRTIEVPGGTVRICGHEPHRACSTPGCRNHARLLCDFAVKRTAAPKYGDARTHKQTGRVWYVWHVNGDDLTISQTEPPKRSFSVKKRRAVSSVATTAADWFAKTFATCDRWICSSCATTVGKDRHHCKPHARVSGA